MKTNFKIPCHAKSESTQKKKILFSRMYSKVCLFVNNNDITPGWFSKFSRGEVNNLYFPQDKNTLENVLKHIKPLVKVNYKVIKELRNYSVFASFTLEALASPPSFPYTPYPS